MKKIFSVYLVISMAFFLGLFIIGCSEDSPSYTGPEDIYTPTPTPQPGEPTPTPNPTPGTNRYTLRIWWEPTSQQGFPNGEYYSQAEYVNGGPDCSGKYVSEYVPNLPGGVLEISICVINPGQKIWLNADIDRDKGYYGADWYGRHPRLMVQIVETGRVSEVFYYEWFVAVDGGVGARLFIFMNLDGSFDPGYPGYDPGPRP